ncbi:ATP-binding protein [Eubacterium ramulus]|uniref:ATP-binding protein n=1 Tax=Eubacterium ramulus TaxID=39490 RepID=UPI0035213535
MLHLPIYITDDHHIILKGASGNGKTFIACALGVRCLQELYQGPLCPPAGSFE